MFGNENEQKTTGKKNRSQKEKLCGWQINEQTIVCGEKKKQKETEQIIQVWKRWDTILDAQCSMFSVSATLCSSVTWIQWWRKFFSFNRNNYGIINGNQWMFNDIGITTGSNGNNSTNSFKKNKKKTERSHRHATHDEQKWENFRIIAICKVSSAYNI